MSVANFILGWDLSHMTPVITTGSFLFQCMKELTSVDSFDLVGICVSRVQDQGLHHVANKVILLFQNPLA